MTQHPLTQNPWAIEADPEHGLVPLSHLIHIDRARYAIGAIARMVGNSASEPDATGAPPLDAWTVATLLGGVESLCDHLGFLVDDMLERARSSQVQDDRDRIGHDSPVLIQ